MRRHDLTNKKTMFFQVLWDAVKELFKFVSRRRSRGRGVAPLPSYPLIFILTFIIIIDTTISIIVINLLIINYDISEKETGPKRAVAEAFPSTQ